MAYFQTAQGQIPADSFDVFLNDSEGFTTAGLKLSILGPSQASGVGIDSMAQGRRLPSWPQAIKTLPAERLEAALSPPRRRLKAGSSAGG